MSSPTARSIRIAHVLPTPATGGVRRYVQYLCNWGDACVETLVVSLFSHPTGERFPPLGAREIDLKVSIDQYTDRDVIIARLTQLLASEKIDVMHSHHYFTDIYAFRA